MRGGYDSSAHGGGGSRSPSRRGSPPRGAHSSNGCGDWCPSEDLTVTDLIANSRRIVRTARGHSADPQSAADIEAYGDQNGGGGGKNAAVGIDGMDGVDEIVFEKEIEMPLGDGGGGGRSGGYGADAAAVRRKAQTIVRKNGVVCVLRDVPRDPEVVKQQRDLSDRLSRPRNVYVGRDVTPARRK